MEVRSISTGVHRMGRVGTNRLRGLTQAAARVVAVVALWQAPVPWVHQHQLPNDVSPRLGDLSPRAAALPAPPTRIASTDSRHGSMDDRAMRRRSSPRATPTSLAGHIVRHHLRAVRGTASVLDWVSATQLGWHVHFVFLSEFRQGGNDSITPVETSDPDACAMDWGDGDPVLEATAARSPGRWRIDVPSDLAPSTGMGRRRPRHLLDSFSGRVTARSLLLVALC